MYKYPNIKVLRIQNNYKQEYVADVLGISQPEYSKIESGSRRIDTKTLSELCKLYDVKVDELLRRDVPVVMQSVAGEPLGMVQAYGSPVHADLFSKLMDNYSVLVENYLKQQQTTERIINRLFEQPRL